MRTITCLALAWLLGCGGHRDPERTDAGIADAGPVDSGADAAIRLDAGPLPDAAGTDAGATDAHVPDATAPDGASGMVELSDVAVYGNCMPIVASDPVIAFWTADVTGATGSTATLVEARLEITGSRTVVQNLTVDMPVIALSAGAGSASQRKTAADANPGAVCSDLCSGATFALDLAYDTAGGRLAAHHEDTFGCVY